MPEFAIEGDTELEVTLSRRGNDVFAEGRVTFVQELECSRCSKAMSSRRTEDVKAIYLPYAPLDGDLELSESDIDVLYYQGDIVDLEQPVRDSIVLSIPMRPLCNTNCRGLCPACGANLNEEKCECTLKAIDPRWKALEELFF
jgi:uncharacterized protein